MARSLNKVQIIGNMTQDPEVRQTPSGQSVCSLGVATNRQWTDQSGQKQERAEFHNIVLWRGLADVAGQYLKKGAKVYIEGRLETRNWEAQDGTKRYRTEIIAENLIMLDSKKTAEQGYGGGAQSFPADEVPTIKQEPAAEKPVAEKPAAEPVVETNIFSAPEPAKAAETSAAPTEDKSDDEEIKIEDIPF